MTEEHDSLVGEESVEDENDRMGISTVGVEMSMEGWLEGSRVLGECLD